MFESLKVIQKNSNGMLFSISRSLPSFLPLGHVVVYGSSLSAYSTANSLLLAGLPPDRLTLALPHLPRCFNNPVVEEKVGMALQELGVTTLVGVQVEGWRCEGGEGVKEVELKGTGEESFTLECKVRWCDV